MQVQTRVFECDSRVAAESSSGNQRQRHTIVSAERFLSERLDVGHGGALNGPEHNSLAALDKVTRQAYRLATNVPLSMHVQIIALWSIRTLLRPWIRLTVLRSR